MIERVAFGALAAALLFSGLMAMGARNLVHAVLWLGVTLATTSIFYILLSAPFLATIQLVLYTGGVLTLMLFGVMLTRRGGESDGVILQSESRGHRRALPLVLLMAGLLVTAIRYTPDLTPARLPTAPTTAELGRRILGEHLLAFEVLSVLLLAAMIGAIVLARRKDAGDEPPDDPRARAAALPGSRPGGDGT